MRLQPKFDRVLLKRETLQREGSKIIIPEQVAKANASERGIVVACGPTVGIWKDGEKVEDVRVGERVIFAKHAGVEVKVNDEQFWLIQDADVLCVITEDGP